MATTLMKASEFDDCAMISYAGMGKNLSHLSTYFMCDALAAYNFLFLDLGKLDPKDIGKTHAGSFLAFSKAVGLKGFALRDEGGHIGSV
jgi:hypothetical protein